MANPQLTKEQREKLFSPLFDTVKNDLKDASKNDSRLLWALRRKLVKELGYLERGTPAHRKQLKSFMWKKQKGICALCEKSLIEKGSELDRIEAFLGYKESNVRLVHHECHIEDQKSKSYT